MTENRTQVVDAVVSTSLRDDRQASRMHRAFSILLFAVFVIVDLLALVTGAQSYGSLSAMQQKNDALIMSLGPVASSVRANDTSGSVAVGDGPEGRSLVLVQHDGEDEYEIRMYLFEGAIVQEYALADAPYAPEKATALCKSTTFDFTYKDGLLTITTDAGSAQVALRNLQGGE